MALSETIMGETNFFIRTKILDFPNLIFSFLKGFPIKSYTIISTSIWLLVFICNLTEFFSYKKPWTQIIASNFVLANMIPLPSFFTYCFDPHSQTNYSQIFYIYKVIFYIGYQIQHKMSFFDGLNKTMFDGAKHLIVEIFLKYNFDYFL